MAKKGQTFKAYTDEERQAFIDDMKAGMSIKELSKKYRMPIGTVNTWKHRYKRLGTLEPSKRGKPSASEEKGYQIRYEILKKFMDFSKGGGKKK